MPKAGDPRVVVRMSPEDLAAIRAAAEVGNIAVSALVRECAVRYCAKVAADVRLGEMQAPVAPSGRYLRRAKAIEATKGQVRPASSLAEDWLAQRQGRVNADRERSKSKAKR